MKITNEQLRALQESEARRAKSSNMPGEFNDILIRQLEKEEPGAQAVQAGALATTQGIASFSLAEAAEVTPASATPGSREASQHMDGMVSTFERYANELAQDGGADLREAYALLESMNAQIAEFKERFPDADRNMPELGSMLNELDVLAATETFKFNRGDYL